MSAEKRKADTEPESPSKRFRCASEPARLAVPAQKRKASPLRDRPSKKQKAGPTDTVSNEALRRSGAPSFPFSYIEGKLRGGHTTVQMLVWVQYAVRFSCAFRKSQL